MSRLWFAVLVLAMVGGAQAQMIAEWDNTPRGGNETNAPADGLAANMASGLVARGDGVLATGYTNTFAFRDPNQSLSLADALANDAYFSITLAADVGYVMGFTNIRVRLTGQNSLGGNDRIFTVFADHAGFSEGAELTAFTVTGNTTLFNADLSAVASIQEVGSVEFRIYVHGVNVYGPFDQNGIGHAFWADAEPPDLIFHGTVSEGDDPPPVDEPEFAQIDWDGVWIRAQVESRSGFAYALQYTVDLTADAVIWNPVQVEEGTGSAISLLDQAPDDPVRVYRVLETPL